MPQQLAEGMDGKGKKVGAHCTPGTQKASTQKTHARHQSNSCSYAFAAFF